MDHSLARLRRAVFGPRLLLWALGLCAWPIVLSQVSAFFEKPFLLPFVLVSTAFFHTIPVARTYKAGPWTFLDTLAMSGICALLPVLAQAFWGMLDPLTLGFLSSLCAFTLPGLLGMVWPVPRVSPERLRRDVEDAVLHALADGRLAQNGRGITRVVLDPSVCHGATEDLFLHDVHGRKRIPVDDHAVRLIAVPLMVAMDAHRVLHRTDGLTLDLLAPYGLPVTLPTATWQAFPELVVWEAPTSAHAKLALAHKLARMGARTLPAAARSSA